MSTLRMMLAEIGHRKINFLLSLLAVAVAVALFVAGPLLVDAFGRQTDALLADLEDKTRKTMRDMGFNLMIVHEDTDMSDFWSSDFAKTTMPQEYVERLAADARLTKVTHLVATLQERIEWQNRKVLLVGYLPETPKVHKPQTKFAKRQFEKKKAKIPMGQNVEPGTVLLGHELGIGKKEGETVDILGKPFRIAAVVPERGSKEDITLKVSLADAQEVLDKPGRVNQILALECKCKVGDLHLIREQLEKALPEAKVTEFQSIAMARARQREDVKQSRHTQEARMRRLALVSTLLVVLACGTWVGMLALLNVRERRTEIGLLRALGKRSGMIAGLFLGKAVLLGLLGAVIGLAAGTYLAGRVGQQVFEVSLGPLAGRWDVFLVALLGAPLLAAVASYLPTLAALTQDPAVVLRDH